MIEDDTLPLATQAEAVVTEDKPDTPDSPEGEVKAEPKAERHPLEKELAKERRRIQNLTRRNYDLQAQVADRLQSRPIADTNTEDHADSEALSLPKAEVDRLIEKRARELAPSIMSEQQRREQMHVAAREVREAVGADRFDELTNDLAHVFDQQKQMNLLRTPNPAALLEYLTDPENGDEADSIAKMDDFAAGMALAKLSSKLTNAAARKPKASSAPEPLEALKGAGPIKKSIFELPYAEYVKAREKQLRGI